MSDTLLLHFDNNHRAWCITGATQVQAARTLSRDSDGLSNFMLVCHSLLLFSGCMKHIHMTESRSIITMKSLMYFTFK